MSEENVNPETAPTQGDTQGDTTFLEGTYKGQKVSWDEDTARKLAQKGLDYETKKARLDADRQAMQADQEDFGRFKQWRDSLRNDPRRAEAVARAYEDPDVILAGGQDDGGDGDPEHRPKRRSTPPSAPTEVLELRNTVEQLQSQLAGLSSETAKDKQAQRLGRAADSFSFLSKNSDAKDLALETAEGLMARDSEMSPEGAMSIAANRVKKLLQGQAQEKLERKGKGDEMRTVPTAEGTPVPAVTEQKKKHDPRKRRGSALRDDVLRELRSGVFKDRFQNF